MKKSLYSPLQDLNDLENNKHKLPVTNMTTNEAWEFVYSAFPDRHQFNVNWLRLEADIRKVLVLETSYENRLMLVDILLGEHTGRGTEMAPR